MRTVHPDAFISATYEKIYFFLYKDTNNLSLLHSRAGEWNEMREKRNPLR